MKRARIGVVVLVRATIGSLGDHLVVLTQPAQKEFYDVLVAIDEIAAVEARAREQ